MKGRIRHITLGTMFSYFDSFTVVSVHFDRIVERNGIVLL